ncbi:hypothetical protein D9M68_758840 [compost metagenome]
MAGFGQQLGQAFARQLHGVDAREAGQTQPQRGGAEVVTRAHRVLHHQAHALETHEVAVRLGGAHAGGGGQVAQHQRARCFRQGIEQLETHLHRLDARALRLVLVRIGDGWGGEGVALGGGHGRRGTVGGSADRQVQRDVCPIDARCPRSRVIA